MELVVQKGVGKTHAKWSPVCTAYYRNLPDIVIKTPILGDDAKALKKLCPMGVFDIEDLGSKGKFQKLIFSKANKLKLGTPRRAQPAASACDTSSLPTKSTWANLNTILNSTLRVWGFTSRKSWSSKRSKSSSIKQSSGWRLCTSTRSSRRLCE